MSLGIEFTDLRVLCTELLALDTASRELDQKRAKAVGAAALMFEMARDEMNKELDIIVKRIRKVINDGYSKQELAYWTPNAKTP